MIFKKGRPISLLGVGPELLSSGPTKLFSGKTDERGSFNGGEAVLDDCVVWGKMHSRVYEAASKIPTVLGEARKPC